MPERGDMAAYVVQSTLMKISHGLATLGLILIVLTGIAVLRGAKQPRSQPENRLIASPLSGPAPLSVTFTGKDLGFMTSHNGIYLHFGDGIFTAFCRRGMCIPTRSTHIYKRPGTYQAALINYGRDANSVLGTVVITVQ